MPEPCCQAAATRRSISVHPAAQPRVIMGSMYTAMEDAARDVPRMAAFYAERARHGVG